MGNANWAAARRTTMRLSTEKDDPGYIPKARARVFLNGSEVRWVLTADEEQRLVVQADLDERGDPQLAPCGTKIKTVVRCGEVRIELLTQGELWSFLRSVMSQGADIRCDYESGRHKSYEAYSARLDAAAAERAEELLARLQAPNAEAQRLPAGLTE